MEGFEVLTACNREEALDLCRRERPDASLMDERMPVVNGHEVARNIGAGVGGNVVPFPFLTGMDEDVPVAFCTSCGGDDHLQKLYKPVRLRRKLPAWARQARLCRTLLQQREALQGCRAEQDAELMLVRQIFERLSRAEQSEILNVRRSVPPRDVAGGGTVPLALGPQGGRIHFFGDMTPRGLCAGIAAVVHCEVFCAMISKTFRIAQGPIELNASLPRSLPKGRFLSAWLLRIEPECRAAQIWNGRPCDACLLDESGAPRSAVPLQHVPLRILAHDRFDSATETLNIVPGGGIIIYCDALIGAANNGGEGFGVECLLAGPRATPGRSAAKAVDEAVASSRGGALQSEDVCLLETVCGPAKPGLADASARPVGKAATEWRVRFEIGPAALAQMDPLSPLLEAVCDVQELGARHEVLYLVLAELYSNALEHGLLGLNSQWKSSPDGFARYYAERAARLRDLREGKLVFDLHRAATREGRVLHIRLEQSGAGFDVAQMLAQEKAGNGYFGRGVRLVRSLCKSLEYSDCGRVVEAVFECDP